MAKRFETLFIVCSLTVSIMTLFFLKSVFFSSGEDSVYPIQAVNFLRSHPPEKNIFSLYGWGGYLIWKLPEKKVFIDGRMASWRNHQVKGESTYAYKDYRDVVYNHQLFSEFAEKYNVATILWPSENNQPTNQVKGPEWLKKWFEQNQPSFSQRLPQEGWKIIYQDNIAAIYQKN